MPNGKKSKGHHPKQATPRHDEQTKAGNAKSESMNLAPLADEIHALVEAYRATHQDGKQKSDKSLFWHRWTAWFTAFAFVAAAIYAGITYQQWRDTNFNFRVDQRAWIAVQFPSTPFNVELAKTVDVPFVVANSGKTPAKNVTGQFVTLAFAKDEPVTFNFDHGFDLTYPVMFPNEALPSASNLMASGIPKGEPPQIQLITPPLQLALIQQGAYLATYGWISYMDVFEKWHWVHACATSTPSGTVKLTKECVSYNDTGDGKDSHQKQ